MIVLCLVACSLSALTPPTDDAPAPVGDKCPQGAWDWEEEITEDECWGDVGDLWQLRSTALVCNSDRDFSWQVGDLDFACELYPSGSFACAYVEGDHATALSGRFEGDSADGAFLYRNDRCDVRGLFWAQVSQ